MKHTAYTKKPVCQDPSLGLTADELADQEDCVADRFEQLGVGEDDTEFLRADATERRRLAAIIAAEEIKTEREERELRAALRAKKRKKRLDKHQPVI
jgi:hypothetical protein